MHWTQKGQKRDGLVREWPEKHTFFSQQDRLYSMDAPFMPPGFIASNAKVLIRLKPDGSLIEEQLENAEGDTEENCKFGISDGISTVSLTMYRQ